MIYTFGGKKKFSVELPEVPAGNIVMIRTPKINNLWSFVNSFKEPVFFILIKKYLHLGNGELKYISWSKK
jgi:hypothetical protein